MANLPRTTSSPLAQALDPRRSLTPEQEQAFNAMSGRGYYQKVDEIGIPLVDYVPGMVRTAIAGGNVGQVARHPLMMENRPSGREMLRARGIIGPKDTLENAAGGMLAEMLTDPTNYSPKMLMAPLAAGMAASGKAAAKDAAIAAAKDVAEAAAKSAAPDLSSTIAQSLAEHASRATLGQQMPINSLFDALKEQHPNLTLDQFHSTLRDMAGSRAVRLGEYTQAPFTMPEAMRGAAIPATGQHAAPIGYVAMGDKQLTPAVRSQMGNELAENYAKEAAPPVVSAWRRDEYIPPFASEELAQKHIQQNMHQSNARAVRDTSVKGRNKWVIERQAGAPQTAAKPAANAVDARQSLVYAIKATRGAGGRATLADVRAALKGLSREQVDAELMRMEKDGDIIMYGMDDPKEITKRVSESALPNSIGKDRHIVFLEPKADVPQKK